MELEQAIMGTKDFGSRGVQKQVEAAKPGVTQERILRVLGMTQRPLAASELENALGLVAQEARSACKWLIEHGYITSTAAQNASAQWTLADKGRLWAKHQGALIAEGL
jgi:predicted transcriptional regulator